jgi:ArsR family transcriptional regulator, lead/cadmium/zinc/bismuth-responsive transcriptional repressor
MSKGSYVQLKARLLDDASVAALAETFKILGDATRVRILDALARAEVPVCDLAQLLGLGQSAVSHQLRLLRGMRLVKSRRAGKHIYYVADDHHIVGLFEQGLEHVQERTTAARELPALAASGRPREAARLTETAAARSRPAGGRAPKRTPRSAANPPRDA